MTLRIKRTDWNPLAICQVFTAEGEKVPLSIHLEDMRGIGKCYFFSCTGEIKDIDNLVHVVGSFDPKATVEGDSLVFEVSE